MIWDYYTLNELHLVIRTLAHGVNSGVSADENEAAFKEERVSGRSEKRIGTSSCARGTWCIFIWFSRVGHKEDERRSSKEAWKPFSRYNS